MCLCVICLTCSVDVKVGGFVGDVSRRFDSWAFHRDLGGVTQRFVHVHLKWTLGDLLACEQHGHLGHKNCNYPISFCRQQKYFFSKILHRVIIDLKQSSVWVRSPWLNSNRVFSVTCAMVTNKYHFKTVKSIRCLFINSQWLNEFQFEFEVRDLSVERGFDGHYEPLFAITGPNILQSSVNASKCILFILTCLPKNISLPCEVPWPEERRRHCTSSCPRWAPASADQHKHTHTDVRVVLELATYLLQTLFYQLCKII